MGSPTVLLTLLGYPLVTKKGKAPGTKLSCGQRVYNATRGGNKPRDPEQARLLEMLAGPHAKTLIKAIAIRRGLDLSKYKVWP
jgi:hypothetical protein